MTEFALMGIYTHFKSAFMWDLAETRAIWKPLVAGLACWPLGLLAWTPGTYPVGSSDFAVDTQDRNDVVSYWQGVYQASEGYQNRIAWSGNYTAASPYTNAEGATATAFVTDVERRLNFFRGLCQVPAAVHVNTGATVLIDPSDPLNLYGPTSSPPLAAATTKAAAVQRAAYMIIRTYGYSLNGTVYPPLGNAVAAISHAPLASQCVAWTTAAWNANHCGNIALGYYGPGALDAYLAENASGVDSWNTDVGHRRWLLYPISTDYATGDTPGSFDSVTGQTRPPTNVLYVIPKTDEIATVAPRFVAYPAAGFFPAALNSRLWSLSYPGAGFASATVTMTTAGGASVPVVIQSRGGTYGYPALVWLVPTAQAVTTVSADTALHVTVAGMTGTGVPASYSYTVTLINPDQMTADQSVFGPGTPQTPSSPVYQIIPPSAAEALQVNCFQPLAATWTEGAEDSPTPGVIANTAASYAFRSTASFAGYPGFGPISGAKSFRLTIPVWYDPRLNGLPGQSFELDHDLLPGAGATLTFKYRRGYMSAYTSVVVETSYDGGVTWAQKGAAITGNGSGVPDNGVSLVSLALDASADPVRIRFRLAVAAGMGFYADQYYNGFDYTTIPTGIFIDDISRTNCQELVLTKANDLAASSTGFVLTATSAGVTLVNNLELRLRMRTKLGNRWMPYGPMKTVILNEASRTVDPVIAPSGGTMAARTAITITSESNATICYRVNSGAEIAAASPVSGLSVPVDGSPLTLVAYAKKAGKSDSIIVSASFASSQYVNWMDTYFPGITDPNIIGPTADPDNDGQPNLIEFALGGDPAAAGGRARVYNLTSDGGPAGAGDMPVVITLAVRTGTPDFAGTPAPSATRDGVTYTIQGGIDPGDFTSPVVVLPAVTTDLPPAPAGYEYRSFKLEDSGGAPASGFLRVRVTTPP